METKIVFKVLGGLCLLLAVACFLPFPIFVWALILGKTIGALQLIASFVAFCGAFFFGAVGLGLLVDD